MKFIVAGDTHGSVRSVKQKIDFAVKNNVNKILVVGDWGHWPGLGGIEFLDECQAYAAEKGVAIYVLGGNHEWWPDWLERMKSPYSVKDENGFVYVRRNILYAPKVLFWKWGGKRMGIAAGAVSIDKQWRKEGVDWWPEEEFDEDSLNSVLKYNGPKIDYFFTHDCSDHTSGQHNWMPHEKSQQNRGRIDRALVHLKPDFHFHGHMHNKYYWDNRAVYNGEFSTITVGLECNMEYNSWVLVDTKTDNIYWPEDLGEV